MDNAPMLPGRGATPPAGEERLLLEESSHRTANEITAAIAALRLAKAARGPRARANLLDAAIARMEGFAACHRLLARPRHASTNLGADLDTLVCAIADARLPGPNQRVCMDLPDLWCDGATARRALLIAAEVVNNAIRHGMEAGGTQLHVHLLLSGTDIVIVIGDDGPGLRPRSATSGTGSGTGIVDELALRGGGHVERRSSGRGTIVEVTLPMDMEAMRRVRARG